MGELFGRDVDDGGDDDATDDYVFIIVLTLCTILILTECTETRMFVSTKEYVKN